MRSNNIFLNEYLKKKELLFFIHRKRLGDEDLYNNKLIGEPKYRLLRKLKKSTSPKCPECDKEVSPIVYHCFDVGELNKKKKETGILMFLLKCGSCGKLFLYVKNFKLMRRSEHGNMS